MKESVGIASNSPQKKTTVEQPLIMSTSEKYGKTIYLSESLDINSSMFEQTVQFATFVPQQPATVDRALQSDKLKYRKKNSKLDLLLVDETLTVKNIDTTVPSPLNTSSVVYDPISFLNNNPELANFDLLSDETLFGETTSQFISSVAQLTTFDVPQTTHQYFLIVLAPLVFFC